MFVIGGKCRNNILLTSALHCVFRCLESAFPQQLFGLKLSFRLVNFSKIMQENKRVQFFQMQCVCINTMSLLFLVVIVHCMFIC